MNWAESISIDPSGGASAVAVFPFAGAFSFVFFSSLAAGGAPSTKISIF